jgi:hypothetical protein
MILEIINIYLILEDINRCYLELKRIIDFIFQIFIADFLIFYYKIIVPVKNWIFCIKAN